MKPFFPFPMDIDDVNDPEATELFARLKNNKRPKITVAGYDCPSPFMQWLGKHHPDFRYRVRFGAPPGTKKSKFAGWSDARIYRWLLENYPDPKSHWVEVILNVQFNETPGMISKMTVAGSYKHCMNQLAYELWMNKEEDVQFTILIQPASGRKKKEMWMRIPPNTPPETDKEER